MKNEKLISDALSYVHALWDPAIFCPSLKSVPFRCLAIRHSLPATPGQQ